MRETKSLEFKESVTNSFLKTVSAYANYGTGEILFGIADNAIIKGIENPRQACLDIENKINDSIDPVPDYTLNINEENSVITLKVNEGPHKPYLYRSKAYRRNDSATVPIDRLELQRLILKGQNLSFEELEAGNQDLTFSVLENKLISILNIGSLSLDTLKTLELYNAGKGYNKAAELLADKNCFCGIDIARFGDSINIILDRERYEHISVLAMYDLTLNVYRKYYQYEQIKGSLRETVALIPEAAFRETLANAIVHRTWDTEACINVAMFADRIEITSPGGLPEGMNEEEYLRGGISILRNRIIGNLFYRLRMIERFGTGIRRIIEEYRRSRLKPAFEISENAIKITLPLTVPQNQLTSDENKIYSLLQNRELSGAALAESAGFGKTKTLKILKRLAEESYIKVSGNGRSTKYSLN